VARRMVVGKMLIGSIVLLVRCAQASLQSRLRLVGVFASVPSLELGPSFKEGGIKPRHEGSVFTTLSINLVAIDRL
jgi:hypothetical protein